MNPVNTRNKLRQLAIEELGDKLTTGFVTKSTVIKQIVSAAESNLEQIDELGVLS